MRLGRKAVLTAGAGVLIVGLGGLASLSTSAVAGATAATAAHQAEATVTIHPGVLHSKHASAQPPTTADCESAYQVACYEPAQIQQAYNLPALYSHGINGRGTTIVIVDSYGSPTIQSDLATFDQQFDL